MNYTVHPNSAKKFPQTLSINAGEADAVYIVLYVPYHLTAISSISLAYDADGVRNGWANIRWMWTDVPTGFSYSTSNSYTNAEDLKNHFSQSKQLLVVRYGVSSTQKRKGTIRSVTVTVNGTATNLATVNVGDQITATNATNLKNYIDTLANDLKIGNSNTITVPSQGSTISNSNWSNYITKANALPHVSGLVAPGQNIQADALYYNNIVNKLQPS